MLADLINFHNLRSTCTVCLPSGRQHLASHLGKPARLHSILVYTRACAFCSVPFAIFAFSRIRIWRHFHGTIETDTSQLHLRHQSRHGPQRRWGAAYTLSSPPTLTFRAGGRAPVKHPLCHSHHFRLNFHYNSYLYLARVIHKGIPV